jgi:hypothetical protein
MSEMTAEEWEWEFLGMRVCKNQHFEQRTTRAKTYALNTTSAETPAPYATCMICMLARLEP